MKRREFITLFGGAAAWPLAAQAQQPAPRIYRLGIVWAGAPAASAPRFDVLRQGLRELGYIEGRNIVIEQRGTDGTSPAHALVAELVDKKVEVLLTAGTTPTRAAKEVAGEIPVVMTFVSDPIASGFVDSLARPGGTITGFTNFGPEMSAKWLELLKDLAPNAARIAVLYDAAVRRLVNEMERAATATGTRLASFELKSNAALDDVLSSIRQAHPQALIVTLPPRTADQQARVLRFAAADRLPTAYWWREYVDAGGLVYYGPSVTDMYRRAASYLDRIFKGAKPADLPVEQPARFDLVVNLKAAKALGLQVPPTLLARADEVIE
jgi:ABC-type uncharacterized transport system substrate-binding protein